MLDAGRLSAQAIAGPVSAMSDRIVTDIELHFGDGTDFVVFSSNEPAAQLLQRIVDGEAIYQVLHETGLRDVHVVRWTDVRYCRVTQRYADTPSPTYVGDGVTVSGEIPEPD